MPFNLHLFILGVEKSLGISIFSLLLPQILPLCQILASYSHFRYIIGANLPYHRPPFILGVEREKVLVFGIFPLFVFHTLAAIL